MRYLGALGAALPPTFATGRMDPALKAQLIAYAPNIPDEGASDLADVLDATPYGKHEKVIRYGLGGLGGLVVGILAAKLLSG